jgi:hypothetical protein
MADIVLAENGGQTWLITGDKYIDDLLAGTLPADITVEFVACETYSEIDGLWLQSGGSTTGVEAPWLINPAIVARIRGIEQQGIVFAQWSAQLDENACTLIRKFAARAGESASAEVVLVSYLAPDGGALQSDLANLRSALIEAELARLGVAPSRIVRASRPVTNTQAAVVETQRIDIRLRPQ